MLGRHYAVPADFWKDELQEPVSRVSLRIVCGLWSVLVMVLIRGSSSARQLFLLGIASAVLLCSLKLPTWSSPVRLIFPLFKVAAQNLRISSICSWRGRIQLDYHRHHRISSRHRQLHRSESLRKYPRKSSFFVQFAHLLRPL